MSNTFVTSWFSIYDDNAPPHDHKTPQWRKEQFINILSTGINVCIYVSPEYYDQVFELTQQYSNLKIMKVMQLSETRAYKSCVGIDLYLPERKSEKKDTFEYLVIINSKFEFIADAVEKNPFGSTHFIWIDFNITYVFRNLKTNLSFLKYLSQQTFKENLFAVAGYKDKKFNKDGNMYNILEWVYWRYCGGFLILDEKLAAPLCEMYYKYFREFIEEFHHVVWEVNFWAWLETFRDIEYVKLHNSKENEADYLGHVWNPVCYDADHNDSIISIPARFHVKCLDSQLDKVVYPYPELFYNEVEYLPSSTAYIFYQGKHIINTRFVNYSYAINEGRYLIRDYHGILHTKNVRSYLDNETLVPICYGEMSDATVELPSKDSYSHGLEDIRLFEYNGKLHFICTNVNYSPNGRNRMVMGEYDHETLSYSNCRVLQPPEDTWCEKNWIPIVKNDELFIIYSWFPMKICKINSEDRLEIVDTHHPFLPYYHKVRGSTTFIEDQGSLLGLVHLSDDTHPRQYFHMFVRLDKETLEPIAYSDPFCFQHFGVEFCIGFTVREDKYMFWVSKMDNNAIMVSVDRDKIPIHP